MKQKINLTLALFALISIIAPAFSITLINYSLFRTQVQRDLQNYTQLLCDTGVFQTAYAAKQDIHDFAESPALEELRSEDHRITWVSADGTVLYDNDTDASGLPNHQDRPEITEALSNGSGSSVRRSDTFGLDTFYHALLLKDGTVLRTAVRASSITSAFLRALPAIIGIAVILLAACLIMSRFLTEQLLKPLNSMAENLDGRIGEPVYTELQPFADKIRSQHEKILDAASARQDFTAGISHELKTPLTAVSGYAELLETGMVDASQTKDIAAKIRHNSDRLLALINDVIRLSELDHHELPRKFVPTDLYELASECCRNLSVSAQSRNLHLSCAGSSAVVTGDRDLIKELIENLIQNAIRYNRENGSIEVFVGEQDGHPELTVSDTGIGIPKDQQEKVFERFYRVDKSRSRETGGTGLGLAIVKHIAEIHDAKISLTSEPGQGTTVRVLF
ncbi:MAG: two-component sensor histidine kinase [Lachnospiraceae bacterium]|nr:two-component sensor histidine kinase [Lachnospiraceae bacterium]